MAADGSDLPANYQENLDSARRYKVPVLTSFIVAVDWSVMIVSSPVLIVLGCASNH